MKPILYNIFAIDATKDNDVLFVWNGLQAIGSILTIKEVGNSSFVKIISHNGNVLQTTIPSGILKNGKTYYATIQVKYKDTNGSDITSESSASCQFACYDTPTLSINGFSTTGTNKVNTASLSLNILYDSKYEDNILEKFNVSVYTDSYCTQLLRKSNDVYTKGNLDNLYTYVGNLSTNSIYYIVVTGATNHNMQIQSAVYTVQISYNTDINSVLEASVNNGHVVLTLQQKTIVGEWEGAGNTINQYNNGMAIVTYGDNIVFDTNWDSTPNFSMVIKVKNPICDNIHNFMAIANGTKNIKLYITNNNKSIKVCAIDNVTGSMAYSNVIENQSIGNKQGLNQTYVNGTFTIKLKKKNGRIFLNIDS